MSTIKLSLCMESVDIASEKIVEFLEHAKVNHDTVIQNRLFAEEVILGWLEHKVAENFTVRMGYRFKTPYVSIEAAGHPFNLFDSEKEDGLPSPFSAPYGNCSYCSLAELSSCVRSLLPLHH